MSHKSLGSLLTFMQLSFVVGVVAVFYILAAQPAHSAEKHYGDIQAVMESNYDGDTITVNITDYPPLIGEHIAVRINGIDTPELHGTTGALHDKAVQAKSLVASMCPAGSVITLKDVGRDKYFRIDAEVLCSGVNVGQKLIDAGLAHPYDGGTKTKW